jgi:hypothetical protein
MKPLGFHRIQHVPDLVVSENLGNIEQSLAIRTPMSVLKPSLIIQKRRPLHEKRRERRHPEVDHPIGRIRSATLVGKPLQASSQGVKQGRKNPHPLLESDSRPVAKPLRAHRVKKSHSTGLTPRPFPTWLRAKIAGRHCPGYPRRAFRLTSIYIANCCTSADWLDQRSLRYQLDLQSA